MNLANARVLLAISGGIAAYKTPQLVRDLRAAGAEVRVVMTPGAEKLVSALALQAVSGEPVQTSLWEGDAGFAMDHIELAKWASVVLVAPATANLLAKMVAGMADDLVTTLLLATPAPVAVAPAMNQAMWQHPATANNVQILKNRGVLFLGPDSGEQACGDVGPGRMREPSDLVANLTALRRPQPLFKNKRVLITAGPTCESWDPVRYLTNHSTGRMGFALAAAASQAGADVELVAGPVQLATPRGVRRIDVRSAADMMAATRERAKQADLFISAAAVADFRPRQVLNDKLKKNGNALMLELEPTEDIVASIAQSEQPPFIVGFAAETDSVLENAYDKMHRKNMDLIVANQVGENLGFGPGEATVWLLGKGQDQKLTAPSKELLAPRIIEAIAAAYALQNDQ